MVAADIDAGHPGDELLAFTNPGALFVGVPRADRDGFAFTLQKELPGRTRDAVRVPGTPDGVVEIVTASRAGQVELWRFAGGECHVVTVHEQAMGAGRVAVCHASGTPLVVYSTRDDGTVWRHERGDGDAFRSEPIYHGPQGPRGIAAGRFDPDRACETVAVFGYSGVVELLTRRANGWQVTPIFTDRDKGHWLARAELDGRNATDELVCTGYGGRIVQLALPPGTGKPGVPATTVRVP